MTDKEKLDAIELLYKQYLGFLFHDSMRHDFEEKLEKIFDVDTSDDDSIDAWRAKEPVWMPL